MRIPGRCCSTVTHAGYGAGRKELILRFASRFFPLAEKTRSEKTLIHLPLKQVHEQEPEIIRIFQGIQARVPSDRIL